MEGVGYQYSRGGEVLIKQKQLWCSLSRKHDFIFRNDLTVFAQYLSFILIVDVKEKKEQDRLIYPHLVRQPGFSFVFFFSMEDECQTSGH